MVKRVSQLLGLLALIVGSTCLFAGCAEDNNSNAMQSTPTSTTGKGPNGEVIDPLTGTAPPPGGASTEEGRAYEAARKKAMYKDYPGGAP